MHRFKKNRWWTYILTLSLCFACWSLPSGKASADGPLQGLGDGSGGGVPTGTGDPDVPQDPKNTVIRGKALGGTTYLGTAVAGDDGPPVGVWMIRLRVVIQGLRSFYLRY